MIEERQNKMAIAPMNKLILKMGLPMIVSMVLQALYNVIDSIFVANMGIKGAIANQALTYAFPIQIMIIAIANGTWGDKNNYDLCIDAKIGNENVVNIICDYVKNR